MYDPVLSSAVWERYERDHPAPGREYNVWVARLREETGIPEATIRQVVGEGAGAMLNAINERVQTYAQQIADLIGADLVSGLACLRDALNATKKKVLLDHAGRPKLIDPSPEGPGMVPENIIYLEVPDWPSRLSAVRTLIEVHGARAPQQIEVDQKVVTLDLTPSAALAELTRLSESIPRLQAALAAGREGSPRLIGSGTAAAVPASRTRRALLVNRMHGDEGRAGQDQSV